MNLFRTIFSVLDEFFCTQSRARAYRTIDRLCCFKPRLIAINPGFKRSIVLLFLVPLSFLSSEETVAHQASMPATTTIQEKKLSENQTITVNGQKILYDAHGGAITFKNQDGKESANIYFVAYFAKPSGEKKDRPIAFCFNGGPASSSIWLHMGFLGPKVVFFPEKTNQPSSYGENPFSLLASCDLVFIDPVSTGFSKASTLEDEKKFCGVEGDLRSLADFIQLFLTTFQRWQSPKLLIGESYGTTRVVGLTALLQDEYYVNIDGLILISLVIDFQTIESIPSFDLSNVLYLPSFAAIAHYHKKLSTPYRELPVKELSEKVSSFALNEYAPALIGGSSTQKKVRENIATRLSEFTSLPSTFFQSHNLRLGPSEYKNELLKEKASIIGRLDGRITTWNPIENTYADTAVGLDPSFFFVSSAFTCAFNDYLTKDLHLQKEDPYVILNKRTFYSWNWSAKNLAPGSGYLSFMNDFQNSFAKNPNLKVFVAAGYYDLATPFFAQQYSLDHLFLPDEQRNNITFKVYEGGHMMYLDNPLRKELSSALGHFVSTLPHKVEE